MHDIQRIETANGQKLLVANLFHPRETRNFLPSAVGNTEKAQETENLYKMYYALNSSHLTIYTQAKNLHKIILRC